MKNKPFYFVIFSLALVCCAFVLATAFCGATVGGSAMSAVGAVNLNFHAISDGFRLGIIFGAILLFLLIATIVIAQLIKSKRKKKAKKIEKQIDNEQAVAQNQQDLGKKTLDFANAVFAASSGQPIGMSSSLESNGSAFTPITLIMNTPSNIPSQNPVAMPYVAPYAAPVSYAAPYTMSNAGYSLPAFNQSLNIPKLSFIPYKSISDHTKLSYVAFCAEMTEYISNDIIAERVYEDIYRAKGYERIRFFGYGELVREQRYRYKRRMYKKYCSGLSVADACKTASDIQKEVTLSKACSLEYLCGFTLDEAKAVSDSQMRAERCSQLLELQNEIRSEIKLQIEALNNARRAEKQAKVIVEDKKEQYKIDKKSRIPIVREIVKQRGIIYEKYKLINEAERTIYYKNKLLGELNAALKALGVGVASSNVDANIVRYIPCAPVEQQRVEQSVIEQTLVKNEIPVAEKIIERPVEKAVERVTEQPKKAVEQQIEKSNSIYNDSVNEYDRLASEIEKLEYERSLIELRLRAVIERIGAEGESNEKLNALTNKFTNMLSDIDAKLEALRKKSISKIIRADGGPSLSALSEMSRTAKINEVKRLRRQLRNPQQTNDALKRLFSIKNNLNDEERADLEIGQAVNKSIKEGLQAAELNKYERLLNNYRVSLESKKQEMQAT